MQISNSYPTLNKQTRLFLKIRSVCRYIFLAAALACAIVNVATHTKPWSVVVIWSLWSAWNLFLSPDIIEFNLLSQTCKLAYYVTILLILIDICLAPGWALFTVPIVLMSFIVASAVFFFIDVKAQMQNSMPLMWLVSLSLIGSIAVMVYNHDIQWPVIVLASTAFAMLVVFIFFHKQVLLELKKRFHTN